MELQKREGILKCRSGCYVGDDKHETYMDKLNKEYIEILSGDGKPSEKFWALEKRIKADKKDCGVQCEMSRSNQFYIMLSLLNEGAISMEDLEDFSDDLKEIMQHFSGL